MKQLQKYRSEAIHHPSPDIKNKNIIQGTTSPVKQVKLFLQKTKRHQKDNIPIGMTSSELMQSGQSSHNYSQREEILRQRINELEMQNNQFRQSARQYEDLAERNKNLQQQMLLLLEEIEQYSLEERHTSQNRNKFTSKQQNNTTQSSHEDYIQNNQNSKHSPSGEQIKMIKSFNSYEHQELIQQNNFLKAQNARIQELINTSVQKAIMQLEQKFMKYIKSMQEKLSLLTINNLEIQKLKLKQEESDSSKSSNRYAVKVNNQYQYWQRQNKQSGKSDFSINPRNTLKNTEQKQMKVSSSSKGNIHNSNVNIQLSYLSESNQSFGNVNKKNFYLTPDSKQNTYFKNIELVSSGEPIKTLFEQSIMQSIHQNLSNLKKNLTTLFTSQVPKYSTFFNSYKNTIQTQIKDILITFYGATDMNNPNNVSTLLYNRIDQLTSQINRLKQLLKFKQQTPIFESQIKSASKLYLQQSYYLNLQSQQYRQFQESKRKLIEIIDIMKSFNRDYKYLLNKSQNESLLVQSIHRESVKQ